MDDEDLTEAEKNNEQRYHWLRKSVSDYFYHVRVEDFRKLNKLHGLGCELITGFLPEEHDADSNLWIRMVLEDDRSIVEGQISTVLEGAVPRPIEFRIRRKDGQLRWLKKTIVPYYGDKGRLIAYDALLSDVTETKQAEIALRESEKRYRLLFEDDLTGDYLAEPDGTILLCNQAFVNIFGFADRQEALGSNLANLYLAPVSWPGFIELLCENQVLERHERAGRRSDGTIRHVIETVIGTFDKEGRLLRIKGYVYDDTDAKLATARLKRRNEELEKAVVERTRVLQEKQEHLQAIWNSAFDAIITIDQVGLIVTANRASENIFGYTSAELLGQNVNILMAKPFWYEHREGLAQVHASGQKGVLDCPRELTARRRDGAAFPIDLSVTQIEKTGCYVWVIRDISERKRMQRHLLDIASEEQRRIGRELHDGTGQELTGLSLASSALIEMLNSATELTVDGKLVMQLQESDFLRIRKTLTMVNKKLIDANRSVHELCQGIMPVRPDTGSLQTSLEELALSTHMPPTIHCRFECPWPVVISDNATATHLFRIAQEAVNNALKHSQASEIVISLKQGGKEIILEVFDNGIGIDETYRRIAEAKEGHGMGMRTMRYRAGIIGGSLQIERRKAGGTLVKCVAMQLDESEPT